MPSTRMHRGLVALSASAIAAVYMTGYLRTQAADATIAAAEPSLTAAPTAQVAVAAPPPVTVAPAPQTVVQRQVTVAPRPSATPATQAQPPAQSQPQARSQPQAQTQPQAPAQTQPQSQPQPQSPSQASQAAYKDGTYTGQGTSRRGDVWVQVDVAGGRISNVSITRSTLQYPLRDIAGLPQEVVDRQSAQVDVVSRATYSSMAFRQAVTQALSSAKTA
jgi:uncharacterized protein with FMN-binding domain